MKREMERLASLHEEGNDYAREGRGMEFAGWVGGESEGEGE
jgi:hypothetical protein